MPSCRIPRIFHAVIALIVAAALSSVAAACGSSSEPTVQASITSCNTDKGTATVAVTVVNKNGHARVVQLLIDGAIRDKMILRADQTREFNPMEAAPGAHIKVFDFTNDRDIFNAPLLPAVCETGFIAPLK